MPLFAVLLFMDCVMYHARTIERVQAALDIFQSQAEWRDY